MDKYEETFSTWDKVASIYEDKFMNLDVYNDTYDFFCEQLPNNTSKVLEVGCGPGNITKYVLSKRPKTQFLGTDISPAMIKLAKRNNPRADFKVLDTREIDSLNSKFDAIIGGFCMPYLSKTDCIEFIRNCNKLLYETGVLYISFVEGAYDKSGFQKGSSGDRVYFYYHDIEEVLEQLIRNGFDDINLIDVRYDVKEKVSEMHTIIIAKKATMF